MKRHWHALYGAAIAFFITCGALIPSQFLPWLSTALMTATAMMWHREQGATQEALKGSR